MAHTAPVRDLWRVLRTVRDDVREMRGLLDLTRQRVTDLEIQAASNPAAPWPDPFENDGEWPAWDPGPENDSEGGTPEHPHLTAVPDTRPGQ